MTELPLIVVDVQRGGPSTGLPTKTEQADLLQALYGRNGESPVAVLAPRSPSDCFDVAVEAVRIAVTYHTPVIMLSDGAIANGSEPWRIPDVSTYAPIEHTFAKPDEPFQPYARDPETLARQFAVPGTPGLEHRIGGLESANGSGNISYEPTNHDLMVRLRQAKIDGIAVPDLEVDDPTGDAELLLIGWGSSLRSDRRGLPACAAQGHQGRPRPAAPPAIRSRPTWARCCGATRKVVLPGDEPRPAGAAAARQVPGRRAVGDQGSGCRVPGRRGGARHRRRAGRDVGRNGARQDDGRTIGGGHRGDGVGADA